MKHSLIFLSSLLALAACKPQSGPMQQLFSNESSTALQVQALHYNRSELPYSFTIRGDYPTSGPTLLVRSVREWISESLGGTYQGELSDTTALCTYYAEQYMRSQDQEDADFRNYLLEDSIECVEEYEFNLAWQNDSLVTFTLSTYEYSGGAHGGSYVAGATFRKSDGRRFGWDMMHSEEVDLNSILKEGLKQYFQITTDEELEQVLMLSDYHSLDYLPKPATDPWLDQDGVHLLYQQYEIAPYAEGMPQFSIPLDKAQPLLTATIQKCL